jgi:hypothetical protein
VLKNTVSLLSKIGAVGAFFPKRVFVMENGYYFRSSSTKLEEQIAI